MIYLLYKALYPDSNVDDLPQRIHERDQGAEENGMAWVDEHMANVARSALQQSRDGGTQTD